MAPKPTTAKSEDKAPADTAGLATAAASPPVEPDAEPELDTVTGTPLDPGPDETLTNEPIEVKGRMVNPKPEDIGATGEVDPKRRSLEDFQADQRESERKHRQALAQERGKRGRFKAAA